MTHADWLIFFIIMDVVAIFAAAALFSAKDDYEDDET